jgi:hypothetical protein
MCVKRQGKTKGREEGRGRERERESKRGEERNQVHLFSIFDATIARNAPVNEIRG